MKRFFAIILLFASMAPLIGQEITMGGTEKKLRLSSSVELRTWKLDTKVDMREEPLMGATIVLLKGSEVVHKSATNVTGGFEVLVPLDGEFILEVSYKGCNTKRFSVNTMGIPPEVKTADYFKPTFSIGGFVMAKAFPGIDYSGLQQSLVKVLYFSKLKNFDDDESYTDGVGKEIVSKIANAEDVLTQKFCATNRAGDAALIKPDCPLAKKLYNEAIALIPGEQYPVEQLKKVGDCLKQLEDAEKKKAEEAVAKSEKEKAAADKAAAEKLAREAAAKEAADKAGADKLVKDQAAKEKAAADKEAKDKKAAEKAEADKLARDKAASDKASKDQTAKDKAAADKLAKDQVAKDKALAQKEEENKKKTTVAKPNDPVPLSYETKSDGGTGEMDKRDTKHSVPQMIGVNKYKETLKKAEDFFKMKRWAEARSAYNEVLKIKPDDTYSKNKLLEIEKHLN